MSSQYLRVRRTMKCFQNRLVVVQLCQRGIEFDEEHVVDTGVAYIVSNGRDKKRERFKRGQ